jgi:hypothetical protein
VDPLTAASVNLTMKVDSSDSEFQELLEGALQENFERLATEVRLLVRAPVQCGGPGIYRQQLIHQMCQNAHIVERLSSQSVTRSISQHY